MRQTARYGVLAAGAASVAAPIFLWAGAAGAACGAAAAPCIAEVERGGEDLVAVQDRRPDDPGKPTEPVNTIQDVFAAFRGCWRGPPPNLARPGTEITIRFSFRRDGSMIGAPRVTFQTDLSQEQRHAYFTAVAEALRRCVPLPFTESFGNAVAGHPFAIRFIDDRNMKKAEYRR